MANYVRLDGGTVNPKIALKGGVIASKVGLSGGKIYPTGGGSAELETLNLNYTPSETPIDETHTPSAGHDGFDEVNVEIEGIPSDYVGSGIARRTSSDLTASGATVTAPSGYYENSASKAIPNASPLILSGLAVQNDGTVEVDLDIVNGGYIPSQSDTLEAGTLAVKGAQTYTPGTTDQTIASGRYLTGAQTILGDANLLPGNIKKDVVIFGITGTYEGNTGGSWVEETISTSGAVTKALDPYTLYHFTGTLTSLTITLNAPASGQIAHYHFDFESGSTPATLSVPNTVTMPDSFAVEASKRYEVDVLNNYGSVIAWTE